VEGFSTYVMLTREPFPLDNKESALRILESFKYETSSYSRAADVKAGSKDASKTI
jgi:hypothetical protein